MSPRPAAAHWTALGSTAALRVGEPSALEDAVGIVEHELALFDEACSRFRDDSELARVNARAGRPVEVGQLLLDALELALRGARMTDGALDPTIGRSLELAGYDRDWELVTASSDAERHEESGSTEGAAAQDDGRPRLLARRRAGWRQVELDHSLRRVRIPAGTKLDLGATAKAMAADRAAAAVHLRLGCATLVALGGDIATAGRAPVGDWEVHVTDDHRAGLDAPGQRITIASGGLATSSTTARCWRRRGRAMHHIIDPSTGNPAQTCWRTVSVAAGDCTDANIASTGALLRSGDAPAWLSSLGLPARLVTLDGRVVKTGGWPVSGERAGELAEAMR